MSELKDKSMFEKDVNCPNCGRRMVLVEMVLPPVIYHTLQCDCTYRGEDDPHVPPEVVSYIVRAREWDEGSIVVDLERLRRFFKRGKNDSGR